ncbi:MULTISPECIES: nucleotide pyrophosphohydrolase [Vagococcus]|uniref:nucleotide pyrophosphohydrolase n=1 Tax=Vagococcus TaxID=2737 RepID=UPI000E48A999|nr:MULTISPECIES: nucleotide pyrophosphohydrolase [Vagococcus]RHH65935.1 nucleotide pyrophosphohydrolase [Vagococcus sp. AM17-17]
MNSMDKINVFRNERGWHHNSKEKDLAISISLEASELLELFQWLDNEEALKQTERLEEELADVLIYSYTLADKLGFDIDDIIEKKLVKNAIKYPVK